ncbi:MAG: NADH-quinone oxidoreductase subunit N [Planctomycetaceae bacterium]|nr:NADH-quinone oxidoreductase subunit N [Planctomycetaceae bacterium]
MSLDAIKILTPELIVILTATLIYVLGAFLPGRHWGRVAMLGLIGAAIALYCTYEYRFWPEGAQAPLASVEIKGPIAVDLFGQYIRWLALLVGSLFVLTAQRPSSSTPAAEMVGTLLMSVAGTMLVGSARELGLLFLGLELVSIPTYVVLYLARGDRASQESTVKYFFLSILSSGVLLYGFTFLYGLTGTTDLVEIRQILLAGDDTLGAGRLFGRLALVLIFAGLGFRITAVPFHFYAPDVFQGTSNLNAGLLSVLPKIVGFTALVRLIAIAMPGYEVLAWRVAIVLAVLTMTLGNVLALWQDNVRRMLAYSSIAHAGYMLIGLAVGLAANMEDVSSVALFQGIGSTIFYLVVYGVSTAGVFAALTALGEPDKQVDLLDDLAGAGKTHPFVAGCIAVFMFSLAGLPPLAGFWGKLSLFFSALGVDAPTGGDTSDLRKWFLALAIVAALNAAIAAAYYLRIVGVMYFRSPLTTLAGEGGRGARVALTASVVLVVLMGLAPGRLQSGANKAAQSLLPAPATPQVAKLP